MATTTVETNKGGVPLEEASLQQLREYHQTLEQVREHTAESGHSTAQPALFFIHFRMMCRPGSAASTWRAR